MAPVLQIRLLGGVEICLGDRTAGNFVSSKAPALVAFLAVTKRPHHRDALAALLWGEMSDADAKNNLRQTLTSLRKELEPWLVITRETVQLNPSAPLLIDVALFEEHLKAGRDVDVVTRAQALHAAVQLYHGDFLAGFFVRDAPDFEEWMLAQRARYRELALFALHSLTDHHLHRAEYGRAIDGATRLLALDPWREEAHRQLMRALAHSGQRTAALSQYGVCRRLLDKELGVEPSAETTALYERIRAAGAEMRHNLPLPATSFVGRTQELAQLETLLLKPECRLVTLLGIGGVGKSRLALQAAELARRRGLFLNGVFFVPLEGVDSPALLATAIADACSFTLAGSQDSRTQLLAQFRNQEVLLLLDTMEHLVDAANWLVQLLQQAPGVKLLVTSRERLNVQWEWTLVVDGLDLPAGGGELRQPAGTGDDPARYSAVQLFQARAALAQPGFALTAASAEAVVQICHLLSGMPLGIELAAATLRHFTCQEIARSIRQNLDFLATTLRDIPARQRSLRAVFQHSFRSLSAAEKRIFAALSVFRGGFTLPAAETVAGATRSVLSDLADKSLLGRDAQGRFQLHELLRQYAAEELTAEQQDTLVAAHAHWFSRWLRVQEPFLFTGRQNELLSAIQAEHDNLRAYWQWATLHHEFQALAEGLVSLRTFYYVRSWFREGADWLEQTTAQFDAGHPAPDPLLAKIYARWGAFCARLGDRARAESLYQQALTISHQTGDRCETGFLLLNMGYLEVMAGRYPDAERHFAESLEHYQSDEEARGLADVLSAMGALCNVVGRWDEARVYLEESVALSRAEGDEHGLRSSLTNLANLAFYTGDFAKAKMDYEEVLGLCRKVGDRSSTAILLSNLGAIASESGDYPEALRLIQEGTALFREVNHPQAVIQATTMLSAVHRALGRFDEARNELCEALDEALRRHLEHLIPYALFELSQLHAATGEVETALELMEWVVANPSTIGEHKRDGQMLIAELASRLSPAAVKTIRQRSGELSPKSVLARLRASQ